MSRNVVIDENQLKQRAKQLGLMCGSMEDSLEILTLYLRLCLRTMRGVTAEKLQLVLDHLDSMEGELTSIGEDAADVMNEYMQIIGDADRWSY